MTENVIDNVSLNEGVNLSSDSTPNVAPDSSGSSLANQTAEVAQSEKMIPQSTVDKIVKGRLEDVRRKHEAELSRIRSEQNVDNIQRSGQENNFQNDYLNNGQQNVDIKSAVQQEVQRMAQMDYANRVANSFMQKINAEMNSDPEFIEIYNDLRLEQNHAYLVPMLDQFDNSAAVVKELGTNPHKFSNVLMLVNSGNAELAARELRKLSDSIKRNTLAATQQKAPEPLSQMKPSFTGAGDGKRTIADFKKIFRS